MKVGLGMSEGISLEGVRESPLELTLGVYIQEEVLGGRQDLRTGAFTRQVLPL